MERIYSALIAVALTAITLTPANAEDGVKVCKALDSKTTYTFGGTWAVMSFNNPDLRDTMYDCTSVAGGVQPTCYVWRDEDWDDSIVNMLMLDGDRVITANAAKGLDVGMISIEEVVCE